MKLAVYNTIFKPILIYVCESWTLTKQQNSNIQANELKHLIDEQKYQEEADFTINWYENN